MQTVVILAAFLLVAGVSAEQPQEVSNTQTGGVQVNSQPSHVVGHTSAVESVGPQSGVGHFANPGAQGVNFEQPPMPMPHYYSPSGMIQVVGPQGASGEQQQAQAAGAKPVGGAPTVRHYAAAGAPAPGSPEQYGQPESAAIPPNYKPFGSWGLYIGGNPADGYYSNYYKALSSSVADKQQAGGESPMKPQAFVAGQGAEFGPSPVVSMKQGPVYPQTAVAYQDQGYYPYGEYYTPADLNSGSRVTVQNQMMPSVYSSGAANEYPAQPQPQPQQTPAVMYYAAEQYAARKGGPPAPAPASFGTKGDVQAPLSPVKGYQQQQQHQQRMSYAYASQAGAYPQPQQQVALQQASYQPQAQAQVVAYPVPVGSQMVGSQPGADGAYQPYGVHGFTRYAVRPTVVNTEQVYYPTGVHSAPVSQFPVYKQQFATVGYQQPMSFYGYPLSQLHYSTGAVGPVFGGSQSAAQQQQQQQQQSSGQVSAASVAQSAAAYQAAAAAAGPQQPPQVSASVVEHTPNGPVAHGPAMPEAASSEKFETTSSQVDKHVAHAQAHLNKLQQVQQQAQQQQAQAHAQAQQKRA